MELNRLPHVPPRPLCPVSQEGPLFTILPERFFLDVNTGAGGNIEMSGMFLPAQDEGQGGYICTGFVSAVDGSTQEQYILAADTEPHRLQRLQHEVGKILCTRIKECHGVTPSGECWALGNTALQTVLENIIENDT